MLIEDEAKKLMIENKEIEPQRKNQYCEKNIANL
jgi:hypothetical protein